MDWIKELQDNKPAWENFCSFLNSYGIAGLEQALHNYTIANQNYSWKRKNTTIFCRMNDIYYLEIQGHTIIIHTKHGCYQKYGTLKKELDNLTNYGFIRCSQSCLVSASKIQAVKGREIILKNNERLHISKDYVSSVISSLAP